MRLGSITRFDELGDRLLQDPPERDTAGLSVERAVGPNMQDFLARTYQVFYSDEI